MGRADDDDAPAEDWGERDAGVLVLSGPPCSGKSSVGRLLRADPIGSWRPTVHIEVDSLFSLLLPGSDRNRDDRMLAYDAAHALTRMLVQRGRTVVLECTYARREQRISLLNALADLPATPLWVVELAVSPDLAAQRFEQRHQATDLDEQLVRERAAAFPYSDQAHRLEAAGGATPEDLACGIVEWWRRRPRSVDRAAWARAGRAWD